MVLAGEENLATGSELTSGPSFPNMDILLRIYLCMFVTNVYVERSFSKLKLIKNYLRNTDERLTGEPFFYNFFANFWLFS